ncbi:bifunctional adenosylcobinamide kinase/adenosylcobinamide-phosphate guanylyltransferase [Paraburkholderia bonniea]|uniref:bifunctional adenosylcobinamide kinase/adenosylcobinamide-phosphate guanylyltransferase n=1 Tax=Paraburkholderia bonniea TaxID=2152891 RepID=UPI00129196FA|nr:bifunctional adenosylcobinamide kinase/adenosylcobinamide-phosphate guanylyltransferase [Paraburkholderia bonniea]WJF89540.1 bifunctional adenosylcobinamide kinase/adenosylcobinamide-phosphate guanylyltransferase [Paraburkholderia bonniea]WJF92854.1 bifunctional adenosylcobinamide kinase/adenosylcobinamide-phosphate guanylyltransferase [Paraburkholderia bonniea]
MPAHDLTFVLGGARSGKSAYAEQLALAGPAHTVTYIATARIADDEFAARVAHHQARRPPHWLLRETPLELASALAAADGPGHCVLIDCLTLWLANFLCPPEHAAADASADYPAQLVAFETALLHATGQIIVVSNEIGLGVVPTGALTRQYVDELGRLNQRIAALSPRVTLMVAGLPLTLKTTPAATDA